MNAAEKIVALTAPLARTSLIEASAGTGKTWTLAGLFVRLVIEKGLPVEGILAVTFTRAATAELRERIRRKLQDMLDALSGLSVEDTFCEQLALRIASGPPDIAGSAGVACARQRLTAALRGFDDAAIYTIHGFCQRVLGDRAFSSAMPFDTEIATGVQELLSEIVADFWRARIASPGAAALGAEGALAHEAFVGWLSSKSVTPESLERWLRALLGRGEFRIDRTDTEHSIARLLSCLEQRPKLALLWRDYGEDIVSLLEAHDGLNRNRYPKNSIAKWAAEVENYLRGRGAACVLPEKFFKFTAGQIAAAANNGRQPPEHVFFQMAEDYYQAIENLTRYFNANFRQLKLDLLEYARAELRTRLRERRVLAYDDLLLNLHDALHGAGGERFAAALRQAYPAALIDEFQDTDPLQYAIFDRIYGGADDAALFLVGDPKQAIYSFRGADLFTYLKAAKRCRHRHALTESQRSAPALVQALNTMFAASSNPFRFAQIGYSEIRAAVRPRLRLREHGEDDLAPLRFFLCDAKADSKVTKGDAAIWAAQTVAAEIARLLNDARIGNVRLGEQSLAARDMAVLVNNHRQATLVRRALNDLGIACAEYSNDSVFDSDEAEQLERLLRAVQKPQHEAGVRAALASDLFGCSAARLAGFEDKPLEWETRLNAFVRYHELWRQGGFMPMFHRLIGEQQVVERLAGFADGERRLTNLFHLAELLHAKSESAYGMQAQVEWLSGKRRGCSGDDSEEAQLRLESDENLIQIVTIHRSKGLEYAVTFVPFLWDDNAHISANDKEAAVFYHDPAHDYRPALDFASTRQGDAIACAREEELAEQIRLAYVALTRAKNRCYLFWGRINRAQRSPLAWLLHGVDGGVRGDSALPDDAGLRRRIEELARRAGGAIRVVEPGPESALAESAASAAPELIARAMVGHVPQAWRLASFSSLHRAAHEELREEWRAESPDHDQAAALASDARKTQIRQPGGDRFAFPRGSSAGDCLHHILERIDFSAPSAIWRPIMTAALREAGYREAWSTELARWLRAVLDTPLAAADGAPVLLASLTPRAVVKELEFHLPLNGANPAQLSEIAARHRILVPALARAEIEGYLKGYIDLVFRHGGRFYIADYKSNWLGDTEIDYAPPQIDTAMGREGYHLQYLLYCTALHRWLRQRILDYDYDRHVGGVFYLFLRGMDPAWRNADGTSRGVFRYRPERALIDAIDAALRGTIKTEATWR